VLGKADALGIRETVETSDGIVQRIKFTKDEIPAVLDYFRAEKDRLEKFGPTFWAYSSPVVIGLSYLLPAGLGILSFFSRMFVGHNEVSDLIFKSHVTGGLFDLGVAVIFSLLFAYDGIPRASRISARWDLRDVRHVIECLEERPRVEAQKHRQDQGYILEEFYIDVTPQGEVKVGVKFQNGNFGYLGNEYADLRGLSRNKFWGKI
ncbi:MAG: hypothetical protein LBR79_02530, partial [Oscillospiraceae bacterium]|jgi:hypothetical protein|nr:hypothetical protein [Oscillospiraceae bacterium]